MQQSSVAHPISLFSDVSNLDPSDLIHIKTNYSQQHLVLNNEKKIVKTDIIDIYITEENDESLKIVTAAWEKNIHIKLATTTDDDDDNTLNKKQLQKKQLYLTRKQQSQYKESVKYNALLTSKLEKINFDLFQNYIKLKRDRKILAKFEAKAKNIIFVGVSTCAIVGTLVFIGPSVITFIINNIGLIQTSPLKTLIRASLESFLNLSESDLIEYDILMGKLLLTSKEITGVTSDKLLETAFNGKNPLYQVFFKSDMIKTDQSYSKYQDAVLAFGNFLLEKSTPSWMKPLNSLFGERKIAALDDSPPPKTPEQTGLLSYLSQITTKVEKTIKRSLLRKTPLPFYGDLSNTTDEQADVVLSQLENSYKRFLSFKNLTYTFKNYSLMIKDVWAVCNGKTYADPNFINNRLNLAFSGVKQNKTFRKAFNNIFTSDESIKNGIIKGNFQLFLKGTANTCFGYLTNLFYDDISDSISSSLHHLSSSIINTTYLADDDDKDDEQLREYKRGLKESRVALIRSGLEGEIIVDELKKLSIVTHPDYEFDAKDINVLENSWRKFVKTYKKLNEDSTIGIGFLWFGATVFSSAAGEILVNNTPQQNEIGTFRDYCNLMAEPYLKYIKDLVKGQSAEYISKYIETPFLLELNKVYEQSLDFYIRRPIIQSDYYVKVAEWGKNNKQWLIDWINRRLYLSAYINGVIEPLIIWVYTVVSSIVTEPVPKLLADTIVKVGVNRISIINIFNGVIDTITRRNILDLFNGMSRIANLNLYDDDKAKQFALAQQLLKLQPGEFSDQVVFGVKESQSFEEAMNYDIKGDITKYIDAAHKATIDEAFNEWVSSTDFITKYPNGATREIEKLWRAELEANNYSYSNYLRQKAKDIITAAIRGIDSKLYSLPHGKRYNVDTAKIMLPGGGALLLKGDEMIEYNKRFQQIIFKSNAAAYLISSDLKSSDLTLELLETFARQGNFNSDLVNEEMLLNCSELYDIFKDKKENIIDTISDYTRTAIFTLNKNYMNQSGAIENLTKDGKPEYIVINGETHKVRKLESDEKARDGDIFEELFGFKIEKIDNIPDAKPIDSINSYLDDKFRRFFGNNYIDKERVKPTKDELALDVSVSYDSSLGFVFYNNIKTAEDLYYKRYVLDHASFFSADSNLPKKTLVSLEQALKINPKLGKIIYNLFQTEQRIKELDSEFSKMLLALDHTKIQKKIQDRDDIFAGRGSSDPQLLLYCDNYKQAMRDRYIYSNALRSAFPSDLSSVFNIERSNNIGSLLTRFNKISQSLTKILNGLPEITELSEQQKKEVTDILALEPRSSFILTDIAVLQDGDNSKDDVTAVRSNIQELIIEIEKQASRLRVETNNYSDISDFYKYAQIIETDSERLIKRSSIIGIKHDTFANATINFNRSKEEFLNNFISFIKSEDRVNRNNRLVDELVSTASTEFNNMDPKNRVIFKSTFDAYISKIQLYKQNILVKDISKDESILDYSNVLAGFYKNTEKTFSDINTENDTFLLKMSPFIGVIGLRNIQQYLTDDAPLIDNRFSIEPELIPNDKRDYYKEKVLEFDSYLNEYLKLKEELNTQTLIINNFLDEGTSILSESVKTARERALKMIMRLDDLRALYSSSADLLSEYQYDKNLYRDKQIADFSIRFNNIMAEVKLPEGEKNLILSLLSNADLADSDRAVLEERKQLLLEVLTLQVQATGYMNRLQDYAPNLDIVFDLNAYNNNTISYNNVLSGITIKLQGDSNFLEEQVILTETQMVSDALKNKYGSRLDPLREYFCNPEKIKSTIDIACIRATEIFNSIDNLFQQFNIADLTILPQLKENPSPEERLFWFQEMHSALSNTQANLDASTPSILFERINAVDPSILVLLNELDNLKNVSETENLIEELNIELADLYRYLFNDDVSTLVQEIKDIQSALNTGTFTVIQAKSKLEAIRSIKIKVLEIAKAEELAILDRLRVAAEEKRKEAENVKRAEKERREAEEQREKAEAERLEREKAEKERVEAELALSVAAIDKQYTDRLLKSEMAIRVRLARIEIEMSSIVANSLKLTETTAKKLKLNGLLTKLENYSLANGQQLATTSELDELDLQIKADDPEVNVPEALWEAQKNKLSPFLNSKLREGRQNLFDSRYLINYKATYNPGSIDDLIKNAPEINKEEFIKRTALELYLVSHKEKLGLSDDKLFEDVQLDSIRKCFRDPNCKQPKQYVKIKYDKSKLVVALEVSEYCNSLQPGRIIVQGSRSSEAPSLPKHSILEGEDQICDNYKPVQDKTKDKAREKFMTDMRAALEGKDNSWFFDAKYLANAIFRGEKTLPIGFLGESSEHAINIGSRMNEFLGEQKFREHKAQLTDTLKWASLQGLKFTGDTSKLLGGFLAKSIKIRPSDIWNLTTTLIIDATKLKLIKEALFDINGEISKTAEELLTQHEKTLSSAEQLSLLLNRIKLPVLVAADIALVIEAIPIAINILQAAIGGAKTAGGMALIAGGYIASESAKIGIKSVEAEFISELKETQSMTEEEAANIVQADFARISGYNFIQRAWWYFSTSNMKMDENTLSELLYENKASLQKRFFAKKNKFIDDYSWVANISRMDWWKDDSIKERPGSIDYILRLILVDDEDIIKEGGGLSQQYRKYLRRLTFILLLINLNLYDHIDSDVFFSKVILVDANYILFRSFITYIVARANNTNNNDQLFIKLPFLNSDIIPKFYGDFLFSDKPRILIERENVLLVSINDVLKSSSEKKKIEEGILNDSVKNHKHLSNLTKEDLVSQEPTLDTKSKLRFLKRDKYKLGGSRYTLKNKLYKNKKKKLGGPIEIFR